MILWPLDQPKNVDVPMGGPLPEHLMRNMPRWVVWLDRAAWILMIPYALALVIIFGGETLGLF